MRPVMTTKTSSERPPIEHDRAHIARRLRRDIELMLARPATGDGRRARIQAALRAAGLRAWSGLKKHPLAGTLVAAGLGLAAAELVGAPEVVLGLAFGYFAYEVLRKGASPEAAAAEILRREA